MDASLWLLQLPCDMADQLAAIAESRGTDRDNLAWGILADAIKQHTLSESRKNTSRRFRRCSTNIPTMIYSKNKHKQYKYDTAKMLDISLCGVRLSLPETYSEDITIATKDSIFEIIFSIKENDYPIYMKCRAERTIPTGSGVEIGASFTNCDPQSLSELRRHLACQT